MFSKKATNKKVSKKPKLYRMSRSVVDWIKLALGVSLCVAVSVVFYMTASQSDIFIVKKVVAEGRTQHLSESSIIRLSGVKVGQRMFSVDSHEAIQRLEEVSWISSVTIKRRFPDTVIIKVEEYNPFCLLEADALYLVSEEGHVFRQVASGENFDLPVIRGLTRQQIEAYPGYYGMRLHEIISFLKKYQLHEKNLRIRELHYSLTGELTTLSENVAPQIYWGHFPWDASLERWQKISPSIVTDAEKFSHIDLHIEGKAFVKYTKEIIEKKKENAHGSQG